MVVATDLCRQHTEAPATDGDSIPDLPRPHRSTGGLRSAGWACRAVLPCAGRARRVVRAGLASLLARRGRAGPMGPLPKQAGTGPFRHRPCLFFTPDSWRGCWRSGHRARRRAVREGATREAGRRLRTSRDLGFGRRRPAAPRASRTRHSLPCRGHRPDAGRGARVGRASPPGQGPAGRLCSAASHSPSHGPGHGPSHGSGHGPGHDPHAVSSTGTAG